MYLSLHFQFTDLLPLQSFSPLSFILDFATTRFVLTTEHSEYLHCLLNQQHRLIRVTHPTKMRRYDIVFGILLILFIIDFALAAPVLVQEKRNACVDVVQIPKDVTTILGKRVGEELEKLVAETFDTTEKPVESSDAHASSSSLSPGLEHVSVNDVKAPAPNAASPPANPEPLMESSTPSPKEYLTLFPEGDPTESDIEYMHKSSDFDSDSLSSESPAPLITNKRPSTGPDPDFDWDYWMNMVGPPRPKRPKLASSEEFGQANEDQEVNAPVNAPQPNSEPLTDSHFDMTEPFGPDDLQLSLATPQNRLDQAHEHQMVHVQQPNRGPSDPRLQTGPGNSAVTPGWPNLPIPDDLNHEVPPGQRPTPELTDPELHSDHQSLSTGIQPADVLAAIYEAKGKAIQPRRIPGTARDVGKVASVARLSCRVCEFEKRENRLGSKKGPGSTGNRAGGGSGGQHVAGQQTDERNREKVRLSY